MPVCWSGQRKAMLFRACIVLIILIGLAIGGYIAFFHSPDISPFQPDYLAWQEEHQIRAKEQVAFSYGRISTELVDGRDIVMHHDAQLTMSQPPESFTIHMETLGIAAQPEDGAHHLILPQEVRIEDHHLLRLKDYRFHISPPPTCQLHRMDKSEAQRLEYASCIFSPQHSIRLHDEDKGVVHEKTITGLPSTQPIPLPRHPKMSYSLRDFLRVLRLSGRASTH